MTIYLDKSQEVFQKIASLVGYSGNKINIEISDHIMNLHSYWNEGSRHVFNCFGMNGNRIDIPVQDSPLPFYRGLRTDYMPSPGQFLIDHYCMRGKDMGLTVYLHPLSVMVKALPEPSKPNIPQNDLYVLTTIKSYKPFARPNEYRQAGFTNAEVDKIKECLFQQGFINKAGAITPSGRNIVERSFDGIGSQQSFQYSFKKETIIEALAKE